MTDSNAGEQRWACRAPTSGTPLWSFRPACCTCLSSVNPAEAPALTLRRRISVTDHQMAGFRPARSW